MLDIKPGETWLRRDGGKKYDWREELAPIWAVLKPEYNAIAMDKDGTWYAYDTIEAVAADGSWRAYEHAQFTPLKALILPVPDCAWTETWTMRPATE